ncbi:hypothetical protein GJV85_03160 [Sulfurimonas aquatica]|uniref:Fam-a protein n=1 Tax=Sulfurimonas aquatica TaxID=2672570 RepID=A0A975GC16_9BACT|nr:hypothetical protein [Sulfurimonas aquatica]QSZ41150.1 hypothetical protein GJV85_03160 [Sulfurimonas aquatica]
MLKIIFLLLAFFIFSSASDYTRSNSASASALKGLDCEFEDCSEPEPKVIVKEKVILKEKVVYRDRPVEVIKEKVVYKDRPVETVQKVVEVSDNVVAGRTYNKAFFDVHTNTQAPMLDYITYGSRTSFNIQQYVDTISKIKENGTHIYIHGKIEVPSSITTSQVYIDSGKKYFNSYSSTWIKEIFYNDAKTRQNSDYFLVDVKKDNNGNKYVDYKIHILLRVPTSVGEGNKDWTPNYYFFKMAPKVRGFKNKFVKATPYIIEE